MSTLTDFLMFSSVTQSCLTLCDPMDRSMSGLPVHHQLQFTQTHVRRVSDTIQPSHHLSSPFPPTFNLSQHQGLFKWISIRWPKYWSFSFIISASNEHAGLISFRMNWLDLLAVQGTPKSLLQHHSSKTSILHHTAFFTVQLSHSYVTTGKTIALTNSCEDLTHWKRLWCWEGLGAGGEGDARRWDGWMASPTRWTWVCVNWSWWWTGRPGMLQFLGTQRVRHDWATELNWTDYSL